MSRTLIFWLAVLLVFTGATSAWIGRRAIRPRAESGAMVVKDETPLVKTGEELTEFEFTDQLGRKFSSRDLAGKVWIGSFFFADCPSICVIQNNEIAKLHQRFADQGLEIVNITVTPDKDPPHKLRQYADRFNADHDHWRFLTGRDIDYVRQVGIDIFTLAAADETHTSEVALFDRSGTRLGSFEVTKSDGYVKLVRAIEELLAESPSSETSVDPEAADTDSDAESPIVNESETLEVTSES